MNGAYDFGECGINNCVVWRTLETCLAFRGTPLHINCGYQQSSNFWIYTSWRMVTRLSPNYAFRAVRDVRTKLRLKFFVNSWSYSSRSWIQCTRYRRRSMQVSRPLMLHSNPGWGNSSIVSLRLVCRQIWIELTLIHQRRQDLHLYEPGYETWWARCWTTTTLILSALSIETSRFERNLVTWLCSKRLEWIGIKWN